MQKPASQVFLVKAVLKISKIYQENIPSKCHITCNFWGMFFYEIYRISQKLHFLLSFFITYFANFIYLSLNLQNYMQRHICPLKDLRCSFWWKKFKTVNPEAFSRPNRISKIELFKEKVNSFQPFIIFVKSSILDVLNMFWICSEYWILFWIRLWKH